MTLTTAQEAALIAGTVAALEDDLQRALRAVIAAILDGQAPREAVVEAMATFDGEMAGEMRAALSAILAGAVGEAASLPIEVGRVSLSARLYAETQSVAETVQAVVAEHAAGFQDARRLALELFEGYGFREAAEEALQPTGAAAQLPKYLREALPEKSALERALARLQARGLGTQALRAAYEELLQAIDDAEAGAGRLVIEQRLHVAFYERMRYFAARIARTELHRAYAEREARLLAEDEAVVFVQVRRAPGRADPCICSLITGRNPYGLGAGVYPKARAPVPPFHPFCMCVVSPRLDIDPNRQAGDEDENADAYFLRRLDQRTAGRIAGSQAKAEDIIAGRRTAEQVANAGRDPLYWIKRAGEVVNPAP